MPRLVTMEPENGRYAADLLLLHDLWVRHGVWGPAAASFAHRGWRCGLLDLDDDWEAEEPLDAGTSGAMGEPRAPAPATGADFAAWCAAAEGAAADLAGPPIVIGHGAGALVAMALAARGSVRAAIAIAPLLDGALRFLPLPRRLLGLVGSGAIEPPPSGNPFRAVPSDAIRQRLDAALVPEPAARVRSLRGRATTPGAPAVPALLVAQQADQAVAPIAIEIQARGIEAEYALLPGGHWPMLEERLDAWVSPLHRWIVKRVGKDLLLLRGDEDLRDDEPSAG